MPTPPPAHPVASAISPLPVLSAPFDDASTRPSRQKRRLRRSLRQRRRALTRREQRVAARAVARQIQASPWMLRAASIAAYWPADGELDPRPLLDRARQRRKAIYLPVLGPGNRLYFRRWRADEPMCANRYGIPEPQRGRLRPAWTMALIMLPLVGFDRCGRRLGMGGGFYDRTLARIAARWRGRQPLLLGLAHACQEVAEVPCDPWDRILDAVVTDREWISVDGASGDNPDQAIGSSGV